MSRVQLEVPLEGVEGNKLEDFLMFLAGHLSEALFGPNLLGVLFEGSERLLKQFLGVVSCDNRLVRVYSFVALTISRRLVIRATCAILQLSFAEGESRKLPCRPHLVQVLVQVVTK